MRAAEYVVETTSSSPSSQELWTFGSQGFRRLGQAVSFIFKRLQLLQEKRGDQRQVKLIRTITREGKLNENIRKS